MKAHQIPVDLLVRLAPALFVGLFAFPPVDGSAQDEGYEGGRGLITLEGPSGMFINPTSGTLPEKAYTLQYCVFFPDNKNEVVGHGLFGGYGVTDRLEVGGIGNYIDIDAGDNLSAGGPFARYRLTKDEEVIPQVSVGAYSRFGDDALKKYAIFLAAYKRIPLQEDGFVRSLGLHAGIRQLWFDSDADPDSTFAGYGGIEAQFPLRLYAVGEITSKDSDINEDVPYAFGLQWRAAGVAMSLAGIQNGNTGEVSFYYGIGYANSF
jgi:hypothetical protein